MSEIHPRALVHPKAEIGEGTVIGPDAIIDEHVRIGPGCEIRARAVITGHTMIGARNQIGYGAVIGAEPQDLAYKGAASFTRLGDDNIVREYATIHRGTKEGTATVIGSHCFLMAGSHVAHNCVLEDHVILVNNVLLAGYVLVQERAFLGGAVVVHQFTRIGAFSMTRGQTRLGMDLPPYCMAVDTNTVAGLNRVGLKRNGFDVERRRRIGKAFEAVFSSGLNRTQAIDRLRNDPGFGHPDVERLAVFLEGTKRGICGYLPSDVAD